jgi:hypothetical protein
VVASKDSSEVADRLACLRVERFFVSSESLGSGSLSLHELAIRRMASIATVQPTRQELASSGDTAAISALEILNTRSLASCMAPLLESIVFGAEVPEELVKLSR